MVAALAGVLLTGCALAGTDEPSTTYLALGDSVAFGYDPLADLERDQVQGYPEAFAAARGLQVTNLACPGEASGGFMAPNGADNGCRENRAAFPLHAEYQGTQLQGAVAFLTAHPETSLVTIDLGANDVFLLDHICNRDFNCILTNFVATSSTYNANLGFIFDQLRKVYDGPLVALSIYNPYPTDTTAQYALDKINEILVHQTHAHGGEVADGMTAFANAAEDPCAGGLLIKMPDGTCDVHPTPEGAAVLAGALEAAMP
jgi:lysophospholipase L1-like esterase